MRKLPKQTKHFFNKIAAIVAMAAVLLNAVLPAYAQSAFLLPAVGAQVALSPAFTPLLLKAVKVNPDDPFQFDFIVEEGSARLQSDELKSQSKKLIRYFLASLTTPENDLWVNLSPYEKNRIVPDSFGVTEMGRDLLAQDYLLKQITATLMYPEGELGKKFWDRVHKQAYEKFGTLKIPTNTFNKVWIAPQKAVVYENGMTAYVDETKLKVMLDEDLPNQKGRSESRAPAREEDDVVLSNHKDSAEFLAPAKDVNNISSQIIREIILPELEKEVNTGTHFAPLRQIYNSLILANWYKKRLKDSILSQIYVDKNKVGGVDIEDKAQAQKIYDQYVEAFKKGVYNYIKEDYDPVSQESLPRKYFSGGMGLMNASSAIEWHSGFPDKIAGSNPRLHDIKTEVAFSTASNKSGLNHASASASLLLFDKVKSGLVALAATAFLVSPWEAIAASRSLEELQTTERNTQIVMEFTDPRIYENLQSRIDMILFNRAIAKANQLAEEFRALPQDASVETLNALLQFRNKLKNFMQESVVYGTAAVDILQNLLDRIDAEIEDVYDALNTTALLQLFRDNKKKFRPLIEREDYEGMAEMIDNDIMPHFLRLQTTIIGQNAQDMLKQFIARAARDSGMARSLVSLEKRFLKVQHDPAAADILREIKTELDSILALPDNGIDPDLKKKAEKLRNAVGESLKNKALASSPFSSSSAVVAFSDTFLNEPAFQLVDAEKNFLKVASGEFSVILGKRIFYAHSQGAVGFDGKSLILRLSGRFSPRQIENFLNNISTKVVRTMGNRDVVNRHFPEVAQHFAEYYYQNYHLPKREGKNVSPDVDIFKINILSDQNLADGLSAVLLGAGLQGFVAMTEYPRIRWLLVDQGPFIVSALKRYKELTRSEIVTVKSADVTSPEFRRYVTPDYDRVILKAILHEVGRTKPAVTEFESNMEENIPLDSPIAQKARQALLENAAAMLGNSGRLIIIETTARNQPQAAQILKEQINTALSAGGVSGSFKEYTTEDRTTFVFNGRKNVSSSSLNFNTANMAARDARVKEIFAESNITFMKSLGTPYALFHSARRIVQSIDSPIVPEFGEQVFLPQFIDHIFARAIALGNPKSGPARLVFLQAGAKPLYDAAQIAARFSKGSIPENNLNLIWGTMANLEAMKANPDEQPILFIKYLYDQGLLTDGPNRIVFVDTDIGYGNLGTTLLIAKTLFDNDVIDKFNDRFGTVLGFRIQPFNEEGSDNKIDFQVMHSDYVDQPAKWSLHFEEENISRKIGAKLKASIHGYNHTEPVSIKDHIASLWSPIDSFIKTENIADVFSFNSKTGKVSVTRIPPYEQVYGDIDMLKLARAIQDAGLLLGMLDVLEAKGNDVKTEADKVIANLKEAFEKSGLTQEDFNNPKQGEFRASSPLTDTGLDNVGGIDLSADKTNLEIRGKSEPIRFNFDGQQFKNLRFDGFEPVIINITPVVNLPLFLTANTETTSENQISKVN